MNQRNDFVLGGKLVFSNAGEMDLIRDERFAKMLNNSLGVTLDQFQLIDAISTGSITVENGEVTAEVIVYDEDAFFMCQPPLKPSGSNPEGRKYMLLYGVFPKNNKIRRIFIRSEDGGIEGLIGGLPSDCADSGYRQPPGTRSAGRRGSSPPWQQPEHRQEVVPGEGYPAPAEGEGTQAEGRVQADPR